MNYKETRGFAASASAYPVPPRRPRGPLIICAVAAFIFFAIFFSTSSVQEASALAKDAAHRIPAPNLPSLSDFPHFFHSSAHEPPIQKNSSSGDTRWYSDWKWLNPFSSSVTLDDTRSVLPPLKERPPIYTFYDPKADRDPSIVAEEKKLLTIWRKAWWSQGFKPVILGAAEAQKNKHYEALGAREMKEGLRNEMMRWLAWGHMGTGILANWLVLPMAPRDDHDLSFLRRGQYPKLTRYESLTTGLFVGSTAEINAAIQSVLNAKDAQLSEHKVFYEALKAIDPDSFSLEPSPTGIAFYERMTLQSKYPSLAEELTENELQGLQSLQSLVTSHLHGTFLESYPSGLAVLNAQGLRCTLLASRSSILAESLNSCPKSPLPESCPPNRPKCKPCKPFKITYPQSLKNTTELFTIGTIPHPYTFSLLVATKPEIDVPYIRRYTERDNWLNKATADFLTPGLSAYTRLVPFKDSIASEKTRTHSIWRTAEHDWVWKDLEWHFGFSLPVTSHAEDHAKLIALPDSTKMSNDPAELKDLLEELGNKRPTLQGLTSQADLVKRSQEAIKMEKFKGPVDMRKVVEAWNLADTEAWRFVRALEAREGVERGKWEEEERRFVETKE